MQTITRVKNSSIPSPNRLLKNLLSEYGWHAMSSTEVFNCLESNISGLTDEVVQRRQEEFGPNSLPNQKPPGLPFIFLHQFLNPLIYILVIAGIVSLSLGDIADSIFIFAVILLNAALGTYQEWKAEKSAAQLQKLLTMRVTVRRNGMRQKINARELVPGDIVFLESGEKIPADLRLLQFNNLTIDEALLTGESLPSEKSTAEAGDQNTPLGERGNMAFAGSTVMTGRATGMVVGIGFHTEIGKIAKSISTKSQTKTPLLVRMEKFSAMLSYVTIIACILLGLVAIYKGMEMKEVFFMAVALAVSVIPEGLPVALTVALSIATERMAKRNVIAKKLMAVEGLGSCTYIASDKTGTLTLNKQTVKLLIVSRDKQLQVSGEGYEGTGKIYETEKNTDDGLPQPLEKLVRDLAIAGAICNEADLSKHEDGWSHQGDPLEVALLALAYKAGFSKEEIFEPHNVVSDIPFESTLRYAAKMIRDKNGQVTGFFKGAAETVLPMCQFVLTEEGEVALDNAHYTEQVKILSQQGYRVIVIARGNYPEERSHYGDKNNIPPLVLLGAVGLIDPLRSEAKEAVEQCHQAGVKVSMVTGDHPSTALAIAQELGIAENHDDIITGDQLTTSGEPESDAFMKMVRSARVFARVAPIQKLQIVSALQRAGHFVAVTGDGVNDAPALRTANIGVAMGSGTDITKDTASIIITDDNFASIVAGVEEGRFAYSNIRKVTYLLISTGIAELLLFIISLLIGLPLPFIAVQILWLNLVTGGIEDIALAMEKGEPKVLRSHPRDPEEGIFDRTMLQQTILSGITMAALGLGVWYWLLHSGKAIDQARNLTLLLMVFLENIHVFNCRSETRSVFTVPLADNWPLVTAVLFAQGLHIGSMYIPFMQNILGIYPVSITEWLSLLALAFLLLGVMEIYKIFRRKAA